MLIKKIMLENIRSYENQEIIFPEGSVLLSGNIGSGKSTILLAIDFVLFGLQQGVLTGSSLLRNGKNRGFVELTFSIDGKEILVRRTLKKTGKSIMQDASYLTINGIKREISPTELKQEILNLLNYPKALLSRSKAFIYRYTVYTPQEEMKQILLGEENIRLDILRRVFGIDKYKRIIENAKIFSQQLREKRKELEGKTSDLEEKKKNKTEKEYLKTELEKNIRNILPSLNAIKKELASIEETIRQTEIKIKQLNEIKKELTLLESEIRYKKERINRNKNDIDLLKQNIVKIEEEVREKVVFDSNLVKEKKDALKRLEENSKEIVYNKNECIIHNRNSEKIIESISHLKQCPTCKQDVTELYKQNVIKSEQEKIEENNKKKLFYEQQEKQVECKKEHLKKELDILLEQKHKEELYKLKLQDLEEKKLLFNKIGETQATLEKELEDAENKRIQMEEKSKEYLDIELDYTELRVKREDLKNNEKKIEIEKATFETTLRSINTEINLIEIEIREKEILKREIIKITEFHNWLSEHFTNLIAEIEKQVMLKVHGNFNELFQKWFKTLVEDEYLNIRLNETFSPLIEQNSYEIDYTNLSGGEKTAAALAYRLALNQVINNLMSTIKTRDLIILDEPTDGFSEEQLEKMRNVLNELNVRQIIIVSHETKIESFVDNIIKIEKKANTSRVT